MPNTVSVRSVIDPCHPANNRRYNEQNGSYTFRQRNIKLNFTLGWELEANHVPIRIPTGVDYTGDGSVNGDGAEYVVLPAITKSPRYVLGLLKDLVHAPNLNTDKSCGFHVHVSASNLASVARMRQWAIATEHLAKEIEDLAFKAVPDSRRGNSYCKRITPITNGTSFNAHKYSNSRRYHWLNTVEMFRPGGIRTIEVRLLGHTHRWKYLLAWTLFSMELARRGWELANHPFDMITHKLALGEILVQIAKEIKPLEKRAEPIPEWVYRGLKTFGIESNAWDRPLARISETESDLRGLVKPSYSDNQPELPNEEDEDNDDNCPCGCGDEGRCYEQMHNDGDCDSDCERCHDNEDCSSLPTCSYCRERAHDNDEDCLRSTCSTCHPRARAVPVVSPTTVTPILDVTLSNTTNVNISTGNIVDRRLNNLVDYYTRPIMESRNQVAIDALQTSTGLGMATIPISLSQYGIMPIEGLIDRMLDPHEEALSLERERNQGGR
jgi:hypothetical protein